MKNENKMKELKAAREAALGAYIATTDITVAAYDDYHTNSDYWEAYRSACDNSKALWEVYIAADKAYEEARRTNKMKTENKMNELKAAAWDAHSVEVKADAAWDAALAIYENAATSRDAAYAIFTDAEDSRESAWAIYMNAGKALTNSHRAADRAANTANAYEVGEYETNPYEAEDK